MSETINRQSAERMYDEYAPAIYGLLCKKISDHQKVSYILQRSFVIGFQQMQSSVIPISAKFLFFYKIALKLVNVVPTFEPVGL